MKVSPEQIISFKALGLSLGSVGLSYYFMGMLGLYMLIPLALLMFYYTNFIRRRENEQAVVRWEKAKKELGITEENDEDL